MTFCSQVFLLTNVNWSMCGIKTALNHRVWRNVAHSSQNLNKSINLNSLYVWYRIDTYLLIVHSNDIEKVESVRQIIVLNSGDHIWVLPLYIQLFFFFLTTLSPLLSPSSLRWCARLNQLPVLLVLSRSSQKQCGDCAWFLCERFQILECLIDDLAH